MGDTLLFLLFVIFIASYIQANFGFSFTLIAVALTLILELGDLHEITAVVTLLVIVNAAVAVFTAKATPAWRLFKPCAIGLVPSLGLGVLLLYSASEAWVSLLQMLMGVCVVVVGIMFGFALKNTSTGRNGSTGLFLIGSVSGFLGGLFGAAGPPLVFGLYRRDIGVHIIRVTLLTILLFYGILRTFFVWIEGGLTQDVFLLAAKCLPFAIVGSWTGNRFLLPLNAELRTRGAMLLLIPIGLMLIFSS